MQERTLSKGSWRLFEPAHLVFNVRYMRDWKSLITCGKCLKRELRCTADSLNSCRAYSIQELENRIQFESAYSNCWREADCGRTLERSSAFVKPAHLALNVWCIHDFVKPFTAYDGFEKRSSSFHCIWNITCSLHLLTWAVCEAECRKRTLSKGSWRLFEPAHLIFNVRYMRD